MTAVSGVAAAPLSRLPQTNAAQRGVSAARAEPRRRKVFVCPSSKPPGPSSSALSSTSARRGYDWDDAAAICSCFAQVSPSMVNDGILVRTRYLYRWEVAPFVL